MIQRLERMEQNWQKNIFDQKGHKNTSHVCEILKLPKSYQIFVFFFKFFL